MQTFFLNTWNTIPPGASNKTDKVRTLPLPAHAPPHPHNPVRLVSHHHATTMRSLLLFPLLLFLTHYPHDTNAVTRGPARSNRGAGVNNDHAVIGGESIIAQSIQNANTMRRIQKAATEGEEFVFKSKEQVDAVFRCTACYLSIPYLSKQVVGRFEIGRPVSSNRIEVRDTVARVVKQVCQTSKQIKKDPPVMEACHSFIKDNVENLIDLLVLRTDPTEEVFESDLTAQICRHSDEIDDQTCPPGIPSMADLLQNRFAEQDADTLAKKTKQLAQEKDRKQKKKEAARERRKKKTKKQDKQGKGTKTDEERGKGTKQKRKKKRKRVVKRKRRVDL